MWDTIVDATTGRGELRLILQPVFAVLIGLRLGRPDAHPHRLRPLAIAIVIDAYLQVLAHNRVSWLAACVVGTLLIYVPYRLARALARS